jgi:hypothetical protein
LNRPLAPFLLQTVGFRRPPIKIGAQTYGLVIPDEHE